MKTLYALTGKRSGQKNIKSDEIKHYGASKFSEELDIFLTTKNKKSFKQRNGFAPSETNQCARYLVYLLQGVEIVQNIDSQLQRIFDNGHKVHERLTQYFKDFGVLEAAEVLIEHPPHLPVPIGKAFADAIIVWNNQRIVVEIKSCRSEMFLARKMYEKPKDDHYRQIQLYMDALQIDYGMIIYEDKNSQELLIFDINIDRQYLDDLYKTYTKIINLHKEKKLPNRPYRSITSKACSGCLAKEVCWSS